MYQVSSPGALQEATVRMRTSRTARKHNTTNAYDMLILYYYLVLYNSRKYIPDTGEVVKINKRKGSVLRTASALCCAVLCGCWRCHALIGSPGVICEKKKRTERGQSLKKAKIRKYMYRSSTHVHADT